MKPKFKQLYMDIAQRVADMSYAVRLKVGAIVVKDDRIISIGYNGMPSGWENNCEYEVEVFETTGKEEIKLIKTGELKTRPEVLHAEMNALMKLAKSSESGDTASMFVTHAPCMECAKGIYQTGIKEVFYKEDYRSPDGVYFLKRCGVRVEKMDGGDQ